MSDSTPAISVVIPAYGLADLLPEALASLQGQHFTAWEAVVVDDGSPDDVAGAVAQFIDDPRIRLVQTDNRGVSMARNRAVAAARAPLIAFLDGDDRLEPDYLSAMVAAIEADPRLGFVTCDAFNFGIPEREGHLFSRYASQIGPVTLDRVLSRRFNVFIGSVLRRSAFDQVGGFDVSLRTAEDLDLWIRILEAGWLGDYVPRPLSWYRRRSGSLSWDETRLLRGAEQCYLRVIERLQGRPEATTAAAELERIRLQLRWNEGERLILTGDSRAGVAILAEAGAAGRSPRWRAAMALMGCMPWLAPWLIRTRG
jgi:glycosyltransferase involved in cell wall biosynthesis